MTEPPWLIGNRAAAALRLELGLGFEPIDVWDVIRRRDVEYALHPFGEEAGDGCYIFDGKRGLVVVNSSKRAGKQRFTAAHELGHHELHRFGAPVVIADKDVTKTRQVPEEVAANAFAAYLMAPDQALRAALGNKRNKLVSTADVTELVRRFGLSFDATLWRLRNANLINEPNRLRLRDEADGVKDWLAKRAGFNEHELFPPGSPIPPRYANSAMRLYQRAVITPERLAELLGTDVESAVKQAHAAGYERDDEPLSVDASAAADLLGL